MHLQYTGALLLMDVQYSEIFFHVMYFTSRQGIPGLGRLVAPEAGARF